MTSSKVLFLLLSSSRQKNFSFMGPELSFTGPELSFPRHDTMGKGKLSALQMMMLSLLSHSQVYQGPSGYKERTLSL